MRNSPCTRRACRRLCLCVRARSTASLTFSHRFQDHVAAPDRFVEGLAVFLIQDFPDRTIHHLEPRLTPVGVDALDYVEPDAEFVLRKRRPLVEVVLDLTERP